MKSSSQPDNRKASDESRRREEPAARTRAQMWLDQNWEAIDHSNAWVEEHGLPLDRYRQF